MELSNSFMVAIPVSDAWKVLTDVERIAPHLPGAQLQEIDGEEYKGIVKVKVGPITAQYKGAATFMERDEAAGKVVLRCSGRDTRGQGNANATITALMKPEGDGTRVTVNTDLTVTGKVAQFGRGVMADVSTKLLGQFVDALEADLREHGAGPASAPGSEDNGTSPNGSGPEATTSAEPPTASVPAVKAAPTTAAGEASAAQPSTAEPAPGAASSGPRQVSGPEAKPVDLLEAAGGSVAKRLAPILGLGALILLIVVWRRLRS